MHVYDPENPDQELVFKNGKVIRVSEDGGHLELGDLEDPETDAD